MNGTPIDNARTLDAGSPPTATSSTPAEAVLRDESSDGQRALSVTPPTVYAWFVRLLPLAIAAWGFGCVLFSTQIGRDYGWALFVALPMSIGALAVTLYDWRKEITVGRALLLANATILLIASLMLVFAFEGMICLLMAAPLWLPLASLGGLIGLALRNGVRTYRRGFPIVVLLIAVPPAMMGIERQLGREPTVFPVQTAVEIDAPPEVVWQNVISFPALSAPNEWEFRAGIAYPTHATIDGHGEGAIRYCNFSTGSFEEPIEVWDQPRLLRFSVTSNPPPMHEWSYRDDVHPPHLDGFLSSKRGQFALTRLPNGRTRLEGTTWYQHGLYPEAYWRLWSDRILHRIHGRVLTHIKRLCEPAAATGCPGDRARGDVPATAVLE